MLARLSFARSRPTCGLLMSLRHSSTHAKIGHHDLGGIDSLLNAPVPADVPLHAWELEAHALYATLAKNGCFSTDETRRAIEAFDPGAYDSWGYYEKFSAASALLLCEKGLIEPGELEAEVFGEVASTGAACTSAFSVGEQVIVRSEDAVKTSWRRPHLRTPGYLFGACGEVERIVGSFKDPSLLAYGMKEGPPLTLYRVRFCLADLWSEVEAEERETTVTVDLYANWLRRPADDESAPSDDARSDDNHVVYPPQSDDNSHNDSRDHSHSHAHGHNHAHGHDHGTRQQIERAAIELEGPPRPGVVVHEALRRLAIRKGLATVEALRATATALETASTSLPGADLMVRAWQDDEFKRRLLQDANEAAAELGIAASNPNAPTKLVVVENTEHLHNLVVCTLCSCYPAALVGPAPLWYKSSAYRARAVRRPRRLLAEAFGVELPREVRIAVHDSTADLRFLVLPARPAGTESWSSEQLKALITRDTMVGTEVCRRPAPPRCDM